MSLTVYYLVFITTMCAGLLCVILRGQTAHTRAIIRAAEMQAGFAKALTAKVEENRKLRLQQARIEKRRRKEAQYGRRRNRGRRHHKNRKPQR